MFATTAASVVSLPPDVSQKSPLHNVTQNKTQKIFSLTLARCSRNGAKIPNLNSILKEIYVLWSKEVSVIPKAVIGGHMTSQNGDWTSGVDLKVLRKQAVNTYSPQHAVNSIRLKGLRIGRLALDNVNSTTAHVVGADVFVNWIWSCRARPTHTSRTYSFSEADD